MPIMIVVTAPTSMIGSQVVANLVAAGEAVRVIARDPAKVTEKVEVIEGSHGDQATVTKAFAGADTVFWLVPPTMRADSLAAYYTEFTRAACEAFREHGIARVVGISALGRGNPHAGHVTASVAMDDQIAATGVAYRALAMPSFMDNALRQVAGIKNGVFAGPIRPDLKLPTVCTRDIASVATTFLRDRTWTGAADVPVLGPEDLSGEDQARIMGEVLGTPMRYLHTPLAGLKEQMMSRGMSEAIAQGYFEMMSAKDAGIDTGYARTVETPTTFRQWCEQVSPAGCAELAG